MRPVRLELRGFSAFRETTVIDFAGHDLFALLGPTGSGKSSIIDGIVFALYGSIARYKNLHLIAPIINQLATEARIRLDFTVADVPYTAVRVVRRTESGATTKEARLETGEEVLAGNARELDAAIEDLLGLDFHQFTKTVVLPQGEFARFLTENTADRQALLRRLLGMGQYKQVGAAARERAKGARARADELAQQVAGASSMTKTELRKLATHATKLEVAEAKVRDLSIERDAATVRRSEAADALAELDDHVALLSEVKIPTTVSDLSKQLTAADADVATAAKALAKARSVADAALNTVDSGPDASEMQVVLDQLDALAAAKDTKTKLSADAKQAATDLEVAIARADTAIHALKSADVAATEARVRAGAAGLVSQLTIGDECPVCQQVVDAMPNHDPTNELDDLDNALIAAQQQAGEAAEATTAASTTDATVAEQLKTAVVAVEELTASLEGRPAKAEAIRLLKSATAAQAKSDKAALQLAAAIAANDEAETQRSELDESKSERRRVFTEARDLLSEFSPPTPGGDDLHVDWSELTKFATNLVGAKKTERTKANASLQAATKASDTIDKAISRVLLPWNYDGEPDDASRWITAKAARASADHEAAATRFELLNTSKDRIAELESEDRVASELGRLLEAKRFEQWLMVDVMLDLAERATQRLFELSDGAYSLVIDQDGSEFAIRDHRNADEIRSARTLSGGETFLASLALALALADSITALAGENVAPIESMFLDEGFGTLDTETLDIVASAVEELGAEGRMVGIVTHIPELADRVPVRIRVAKDAKGSSVSVET